MVQSCVKCGGAKGTDKSVGNIARSVRCAKTDDACPKAESWLMVGEIESVGVLNTAK